MKFVLCLLVLLSLAFYVEGSFMNEGADVVHRICTSGILEQIKSVLGGGVMTCEEACPSIVASTLPGMTVLCPWACAEVKGEASLCS